MHITHKIITLALVLGLGLLASCDKEKHRVRKNIDGTWSIANVTVDGESPYDAVSGTYTFGACSRKDNRKSGCSAVLNVTLSLYGASDTEESTVLYRVLDEGNRIQLDDTEFSVNLDGDDLTLTNSDNGEVLIIEFTRD